jgi:uncharacterized integral membrane protein
VTAVQDPQERPALEPAQPGRYDESTPAIGRLTIPRTRFGGLRAAIVVFASVLLLLMIFLLQNGGPAEVSFFGAHGRLPMGVALLLAAIFGVLLVALPGTARIIQLRTLARRRDHAGSRPLIGSPATAPSERAASGTHSAGQPDTPPAGHLRTPDAPPPDTTLARRQNLSS